jgi:hypothetical protein
MAAVDVLNLGLSVFLTAANRMEAAIRVWVLFAAKSL